MYSVHQHWDPLRVCVVGRSYPADFYSFIKDKSVRSIMEKIANETEEDLTYLCDVLQDFGVAVIRPHINQDYDVYKIGDLYLPAPITPRDDMAMVGHTFYMTSPSLYAKWNQLRGTEWPTHPPRTQEQYENLPQFVLEELDQFGVHTLQDIYFKDYSCLSNIEKHVKAQGNPIVYDQHIDSAMVCRLGKDLIFGTWTTGQDHSELILRTSNLFPNYRRHVIESGGHLDGTICPVCPGLVVSSVDIDKSILEKTFPDWEIFYVDRFQSSDEFSKLKQKNQGKWWLPGQESNDQFINYVDNYFNHWLGNVEETSIDVNMLIVDHKNILCSKFNEKLFKKLEMYGMTPHVVPLRHSNFWDGGLHCVTNDLDRVGELRNIL